MTQNSRILIGEISGCFGVNGWLKVFSFSHPRENITKYKNWLIDGKEFQRVESRKHSKLIIAKLDGVDDKDTALTFLGKKIEITEEQLEQLETGEYYWRDLVGLEVTNTRNIPFGTVDSLLETGAHDVIVVKDTESKRERLIPFLMDNTILKVDLIAKTMLVDWHEDD
jgi:16S rRNA processing protein RimM